MFPSKKEKNLKYADYADRATFIKKAKIIRVFLHYVKNYASTIYKGLTTSEHDYAYHE